LHSFSVITELIGGESPRGFLPVLSDFGAVSRDVDGYLLCRTWALILAWCTGSGMSIRKAVNYQLESRMREICTYGSEGGEVAKATFSTPIGVFSNQCHSLEGNLRTCQVIFLKNIMSHWAPVRQRSRTAAV